MFTVEHIVEVAATPEQVFAHLGPGFFAHHSRWDPMIVGMEQTTSGPVAVGTRGWERRALGPFRVRNEVEVTAFEPDRAFGFRATSGAVREQLLCEITPSGERARLAMKLTFQTAAALRAFEPLMRPGIRRNVERNVPRIRAAIEQDARAGHEAPASS